MGTTGVSEVELSLCFFTSIEDVGVMRSEGASALDCGGGLKRLVTQLARSRQVRKVDVQQVDTSVIL